PSAKYRSDRVGCHDARKTYEWQIPRFYRRIFYLEAEYRRCFLVFGTAARVAACPQHGGYRASYDKSKGRGAIVDGRTLFHIAGSWNCYPRSEERRVGKERRTG